MKLNLTATGKPQELILAYLQKNASDVLAEKINNGVRITKDGKVLVNKKTLDGFMQFASEEAKKLSDKGARSACVEDSVVYGWAIHYFEEDSIEGKLYNEDGTEYASPKSVKKTTAPTVPYTPQKPKPEPQLSLFDMLGAQKKEEPEPQIEEDNGDEDDEPTEEEIAEVMEQEQEERQTAPPLPPVQPRPSAWYERYLSVKAKYADSILFYRLGDFYEIFGNDAGITADVLDLTLTGRDCGLKERVPMTGIPFHAADDYITKLVSHGYKVTVAEPIDGELRERTIEPPAEELNIDEETGEILPVEEMRKFDGDIEEPKIPTAQTIPPDDEDDDLPPIDTNAYDPEALSVLDELFGDMIILR